MSLTLTAAEKNLLTKIKTAPRFTLARLELRNSTESSLISTALDNVHLDDAGATMEQVKADAALLQKLSEDGVINLCYTLRVTARSDYQIYLDSKIFAQLCEMVAEGKTKPDFLFDTACIKRGVVTITPYGRQIFLVN